MLVRGNRYAPLRIAAKHEQAPCPTLSLLAVGLAQVSKHSRPHGQLHTFTDSRES